MEHMTKDDRKGTMNDMKYVCSVENLVIMFSNMDVFTHDQHRELVTRLEKNNIRSHIIALEEVNPKHIRLDSMLVEYNVRRNEIIKEILLMQRRVGALLFMGGNLSYIGIVIEQRYCQNFW